MAGKKKSKNKEEKLTTKGIVISVIDEKELGTFVDVELVGIDDVARILGILEMAKDIILKGINNE